MMKKPGLFLTLMFAFFTVVCYPSKKEIKENAVNYSKTVSLNGPGWRIYPDSANKGREMGWFKKPPEAGSQETPVPWVIQDIFHNYHGVAWYWREFMAPENIHPQGRYILKFSAVDYMAGVWVNGKYAGGHEGSETPFEIDVTDKIEKGRKNLLVVRVLNPTYEPIDGIALKDTPSGAKQYPFTGNAAYNSGGIVGNVDLLVTPSLRVSNVFLMPDWKTGNVSVRAVILNAGKDEAGSALSWRVTDARTGLPCLSGSESRSFSSGSNEITFNLKIENHQLWSPEDPVLYRFELSVQSKSSADVSSTRFGFRDFRFLNGYFRLNGKRIFLKGTNFSTHFPVGYTVPLSEDMLRKDVVNMKALGFNFVRIPFGCPNARILDLYDEMGIMVQQEHFGCWQIGDYGGYKYPKPANIDSLLKMRFENSIGEVIVRDRNHASLVMWGVLNENSDGIIFRRAVELLPSLRKLDPSRLFILNSGRFDGVKEIGSMSNPGAEAWDIGMDALKDWHPYVWMPYSRETLDLLSGRTNSSGQKSYISETGLCFPIDLPAELGDYALIGKDQADDALYYRRQYDKFLADWKKFDLGSIWATPEEYISDAYKTAASLRETAESAIRSNPYVVSYTPTNGVADAVAGESMATNFRRTKPELIDPVLKSTASLRWCLRTEPQSIYGGDSIRLYVSLSNLDILPAGKYPATVRVVDPAQKTVFEKKVIVAIPVQQDDADPPYALEVFNSTILLNGQSGKYRLIVSSDDGVPVTCGESSFFLTDRKELPELKADVVLYGDDPALSAWLTEHGARVHHPSEESAPKRELILVAGTAPDSLSMQSIAARIARGSTVVFLSPSTFRSGKNSTRWLPLEEKGSIEPMDAVAGYYRADRWVKKHPLFEGMPSGGMMDYTWYRNLISQEALSQEYTVVAKSMYTYDEVTAPLGYPVETVCGATRISHNYCSGIHLGIWNAGAGKFIVNTLHIIENLDRDPAADRLLINIIKFGLGDNDKPLEKLPPDYDRILRLIGYK
jgi:hypothetical protein